jgi:hypothetical protein
VHKAVQQHGHECLTTSDILDAEPAINHHAEMMEDMQERDLVFSSCAGRTESYQVDRLF